MFREWVWSLVCVGKYDVIKFVGCVNEFCYNNKMFVWICEKNFGLLNGCE